MAITLNGTSGYLILSAKILSALPCTILAFGSRTTTAGNQAWACHSQSNGDRNITMYHAGSSDSKYGQHRSPGASGTTHKAVTPNTSTTVLQAMTFEVTSTTSRTIRFGTSANPATNVDASSTTVDDLASHNQVIIGARQFNSGAFDMFANGSIAEVHFFSSALSDADLDAIIADTVKPETRSNWVDGWTLKEYNAGGTYTSIGGTRTMTAVGGVTASSLTHPIARAGADPVATIAWTEGGETVSAVGDVSISGTGVAAAWTDGAEVVAIAGVASTVLGTLTTLPLKNNTGLVHANQTGATIHIYNATSGVLVVTKSGQTTNASGVMVVTDTLIVAGTTYAYEVKLASGARILPVANAA